MSKKFAIILSLITLLSVIAFFMTPSIVPVPVAKFLGVLGIAAAVVLLIANWYAGHQEKEAEEARLALKSAIEQAQDNLNKAQAAKTQYEQQAAGLEKEITRNSAFLAIIPADRRAAFEAVLADDQQQAEAFKVAAQNAATVIAANEAAIAQMQQQLQL